MAEPPDATLTNRRPWRFRLRIGLRWWLLLVPLAGAIVGIGFRRAIITPRNVASLRPVARLDKDVWQIAWSRDRGKVAIVGWEKPVEIRDAISLDLLETIGKGKKIIQFAFSPREDVVAYCENGTPTVTILDRRNGRTILLDAQDDQPGMVFSPDGTLLATGGYGTAVGLWRVADGQLLNTFNTGTVEGGLTAQFSPDGRLLAVGNRNSSTCLFDVQTGQLLHTLPRQSSHDLQFHPAGHTLAITYVDGSLALWKVADGALLRERKTQAEELYAVDWSPDGAMLATSGLKGKITLWDPSDLSVVRELPAPEWVVRIKFSPDGRSLFYAGGASVMGGRRYLEVLGIENSLYSRLNRPKP
jgi:WD40 repeat protein